MQLTQFDTASRPTAVVRASLPVAALPGFFGRAFSAVAGALARRGTPPTSEPFAYYPRPPGDTIDVEAGFFVYEPITEPLADGVVPSQLPTGTVVTTTHVGPYEKLADTYRAMAEWAATQGLMPSGPMWEVYLTDPMREPDASKWRTDLFVYVVPVPVAAGRT
jgi:effector-binding domain-containing protein